MDMRRLACVAALFSITGPLLFIATLCLTATTGLAQQYLDAKGAIRGTVYDASGRPIAGMKLQFAPIDPDVHHKVLPHAECDSEGRFEIDHLKWGRYGIYMGKEEDGYPDTSYGIYSNGLKPEVVLTAENPDVYVTITAGPKAGVVTTVVLDQSTGQPINPSILGATIWRWPDEKSDSLGGSLIHESKILIPPNIPVGIEFWADGYQRWRYPEAITLPPSGQMNIRVGLRPVNKEP